MSREYQRWHRGDGDRAPMRPRTIIDPITWQDRPIPERRWIVPEFIPHGDVTLLSGDGGVGKSLAAQMLLTACATEKSWLGQTVTPCKALAMFCEDHPDELVRRQDAINRHYRLEFGDLERVNWDIGHGHDNVLFATEYGLGAKTDVWDQFEYEVDQFGPGLVVIDTVADTFGGNENHRGQVRQFVNLFRKLCADHNTTVLLCAHPSRSGMDTGESGSTAWNNSVRSRLFLKRLRDDDDAAPERILTTKKSNYGPVGHTIELTYEDGVFVSLERPQGVWGTIDRRTAESAFLVALDALTKDGRRVNASLNTSAYAPKVMATMPVTDGFKVTDLERGMNQAFADGAIESREEGPPSRRRSFIARAAQEGIGR